MLGWETTANQQVYRHPHNLLHAHSKHVEGEEKEGGGLIHKSVSQFLLEIFQENVFFVKLSGHSTCDILVSVRFSH